MIRILFVLCRVPRPPTNIRLRPWKKVVDHAMDFGLSALRVLSGENMSAFDIAVASCVWSMCLERKPPALKTQNELWVSEGAPTEIVWSPVKAVPQSSTLLVHSEASMESG